MKKRAKSKLNYKQKQRVETLFKQATQHHQAKQFVEAEQLYRHILNIMPTHADALHLLGLILADRGQLEEALHLINQAIKYQPNFGAYYLNRGLLYKRTGQRKKAINDFQHTIQITPNMLQAYANLGDTYLELERTDEAIKTYQQGIQLNPNYVNALNNLGNAYLAKENYQEAINCYQRVIGLQENCVEALSNLGVAFQALGRSEEAIRHYQQAIQSNPNYAQAYSNLGLVLTDLHQYNEAEKQYQKAIALNPENAEFYSNLGVNYKDRGEPERALECFKKSLAIEPDSEKVQFNEAITLLVLGDFENGFQKYESRLGLKEQKQYAYQFSQPVWHGENISGQTLFIHVEQGIGDVFQMLRYLPLIKQQDIKIILECQHEIFSLLKDVVDVDELILRRSSIPDFDYHVPIMSFPLIFKTTLETIPNKRSYIQLPENKTKDIKLNEKKFNVGLVWAGSLLHKNDKNRSIDLKIFEPLFNIRGIDFYSLQYGERNAEIAANHLEKKLINLEEHIKDFYDTALIINQLDLVVTVDTSVAHLAGAMGKPTWILLPFAPDFRWLLARTDSPWYQTVRLFRQPKPEEWQMAIIKIKEALTKQKRSKKINFSVVLKVIQKFIKLK